jgi:hypothetical protein
MIDTVTLAKARSEIGRLNQELVDLHIEEDRLKLRRARVENEKARVQSVIDLAETVRRLAEIPVGPTVPSFHIERVAGARVVVVDRPVRRSTKPAGLPSLSVMVVTALQDSGKAEKPAAITAYVRQRWWPALSVKTLNAQVWHMAKAGKLIRRDGYYGLNGVGH